MNCCYCGSCFTCRSVTQGVGARVCSGTNQYVGGADCCLNHARYVHCAHCNQTVLVRHGRIVTHWLFEPVFKWDITPTLPPWKVEVKIVPDLKKLNKRRSKRW